MSVRAAHWALWLAAALMLPVPILLFGPGWVPTLRLLLLGVVSVAFMAIENANGAVGALAVVLLGQALLYLGLLWVGTWLAARALGLLPPRAVAVVTLAAIAAGVALATAVEIYQTPFAADSAHASLLGILR
jgi:hypothetical protein